VVVQDRLLEALHEAVGEGMARLGPRVADAELSASLVEGSLELATSIGEATARDRANSLYLPC
jgi:hypothetical protein